MLALQADQLDRFRNHCKIKSFGPKEKEAEGDVSHLTMSVKNHIVF